MASSFNPYAAPSPDVVPAPAPAPGLPPGFRRFRLDPVTYRARVFRTVLRNGSIVVLAVLMGLAVLGLSAGLVTLVPYAFVTLLFVAFLVIQARRLVQPNGLQLSTFEILVGPRVLRRMVALTLPAEMLKPEVTRIVETPNGLWLLSTTPQRAFFVSRTLDGFADARALVSGWAPTERLSGWAAWRFALRSQSEQGARDAVIGTALATDPSLAEELELARSVSSAAYAHHPPHQSPRRAGWKLLLLWVCLIVMFLAIWQFLSPVPQARTPRRPQPLQEP